MKRPKIRHTTWDLKVLFASDDDPRIEKDLKRVEKRTNAFIQKWKGRRDYLVKPAVLKKALDDYETWARRFGTDGKAGYYFGLRISKAQNNPKIRAKLNQMEEFSHKLWNQMHFFYLQVARIPARHQRKFLEYAGLRKYQHYLKRSFAEAEYLLTDPEEKILNLKSSSAYASWVRMTSTLLSKEERRVLKENGAYAVKPLSVISSLLDSRKKKVRYSAAQAFNDILKKHLDVAENELNAILANKKVDDELRKMDRPDLARHISDDMQSEVVDTLVHSVSERFDISRRYYQLKAELMGVKKLKYHERNVPYARLTKRYSFPDTVKLVYRAMQKLDPQFSNILARFVEGAQIDVYPRKGKRDVPFCAHGLLPHPTYILLNHTNKLRDVLTFAHELGHGINSELMKEKQNALNFGVSLATAEVASTFMEDFILEELRREADDEQQLALMMMKLNDDVSTIFRQVACYQFELELHKAFRKKGYFPKEEIGQLFQKHMAAYMGESVEQSPGAENWWVYWKHIRSFFYNYSYANGLLISKSLQSAVRKDARFIKKLKIFLSAGLSDSPKNIFKKMGVDITDKEFWQKGISKVEELLVEATKLAQQLGKIRPML